MEHMNIRVLLIADLAAKTSDVKAFLERSMNPSFLIHPYDSAQGAMDFLVESKGGVDIILLDVGTIDRENAKKVFQQVHAFVADIPMIILTGATENDLAMLLAKEGTSENITRKTFKANPERLKNEIEFTLSKKDILKERTGISLELQETYAAALEESEESVVRESRYASEQHLPDVEPQPRAGIWLNGGYYVSTPKTASIKNAHEKSARNKKILGPEVSKIIAFELEGKINGIGTTPAMHLMPYKPKDGPKQ